MKNGVDIGIKDINGKKLHVGDYVEYAWGWTNWEGKIRTKLQVHRLKYDKKDKRVILGDSYNLWKGKDVRKVTKKYKEKNNIPLNRSFFWYKREVIPFEDGHMFCKTQEEKNEWDMKYSFNAILFRSLMNWNPS